MVDGDALCALGTPPSLGRTAGWRGILDSDANNGCSHPSHVGCALDRSLTRPRMLMHLFSAFAIAALLLAAVGTDGVLAYLVVQQRREIGIRLALGAKPAEVLRRVMAQGLKPATAGLAAGLLATLALTRLMDALLFEVRPNDPLTLGAVAGGTIAVAVMACLAPAYRATRLDPVETLRE